MRLRNVVLDGIATHLYDGAAAYRLCLRDAASGAVAGPDSKLVIETWSEPLHRELMESTPGAATDFELEVRRLPDGYAAHIVERNR